MSLKNNFKVGDFITIKDKNTQIEEDYYVYFIFLNGNFIDENMTIHYVTNFEVLKTEFVGSYKSLSEYTESEKAILLFLSSKVRKIREIRQQFKYKISDINIDIILKKLLKEKSIRKIYYESYNCVIEDDNNVLIF